MTPLWRVLGLLVVVACPLAAAHSNLLTSEPPAGARLDAPPRTVVLTLSESVDAAGTTVVVTGADGQRVDAGDLSVSTADHPVLKESLAPLGPGAYRIEWSALSAKDGHHTEGTVGFAVGGAVPPASSTQTAYQLDPSSALSKAVLYAGFSLAFGGLAFVLVIPHVPDRLGRRALLAGSTLQALGVGLLVQATLAQSQLDWARLFSSSVGRILAWRLSFALAAVAASAVALRWRPAQVASAALVLLGAAASARLGHAYGAGLAVAAVDFLHLVATSTWVGGLLLLLVCLGRPGLDAAAVARLGTRFGTLALACVVLLWSTGVVMALALVGWDLVRHPLRSFTSAWGLLLLGKMLLAALMVAVAAVNRYVLLAGPGGEGWTGRFQRGAARWTGGRLKPLESAATPLRRSVAWEAAGGALVLVLAGFLSSTSPPQAPLPPAALEFSQEGQDYAVQFFLPNDLHVGGNGTLRLHITNLVDGSTLSNNTCGSRSCVVASIRYGSTNGTEDHVAVPAGGDWVAGPVVWAEAGNATLSVTMQSATVYRDVAAVVVTVAR
ncbi:MAG: copper resistance CopC/CopD family protein [Thermoplasmatota archaeon]